MAYYIDETKKTAVKFEGKNAFAWNVETRRFDLPASEVAPKSRMTRCSDFEARRFLFENHPGGYVERLQKLSENVDTPFELVKNEDLTAEIVEAHLKAAKDLVHRLADEVKELQEAISAYGMQMSNAGRLLSNCSEVLKSNLFIAESEDKIVKLKSHLEQCERGSCEDCEWGDSCKTAKRLDNKGAVEA